MNDKVLKSDQGSVTHHHISSRPKSADVHKSYSMNHLKNTMTEAGAKWLKDNLGIEVDVESVVDQPKSNLAISRPASARVIHTTAPVVNQNISLKNFKSEKEVSQQEGLYNSAKAIETILANKEKLQLIFSMKDTSNNGLIPISEFVSAVKMLQSSDLSDECIHYLVNLTRAGTANKVRHRDFLSGLEKRTPNTKRPQSAHSIVSSKSHKSIASDLTANYDAVTLIPFARSIWEKKLAITAASTKGGMAARVKLQPGELLKVLKQAGVTGNIHQLKAFLNLSSLGTASVLELIKAVKNFLSPSTDLSNTEIESSGSWMGNSPLIGSSITNRISNFLQTFDLKEIYARYKVGEKLTCQEFLKFMREEGKGSVSESDAQRAFYRASKGRNDISLDEFLRHFEGQETPQELEKRATEKLKTWLKNCKLTAEQAYELMLQTSRARDALSIEQFCKALFPYNFTAHEAQVLFHSIDTKRDGMVDVGEWMLKVYKIGGPYQTLRDAALSHKLNPDDLLIKLDIGSKERLNNEELTQALIKLDKTLSTKRAAEVSREVIGDRGYVPIKELLSEITQAAPEYNGNWRDEILNKLIATLNNTLKLRDEFQRVDRKNMGKISVGEFKNCLIRLDVGLTTEEMDRLARLLEMGNNYVNYEEFLTRVEGATKAEVDPVLDTHERIQVFLRQNNITPIDLLARIGNPVTIEKFAHFLKTKINKRIDSNTISNISSRIDVNSDGIIDVNDLSSALNYKTRLTFTNNKNYPTERLSEEIANSVIKSIRDVMVARKISYTELFKNMDADKKGLLSFQEFSKGLDELLELSLSVKSGLFAIMDKQDIGLVDLKSFVAVMKHVDLEKDNTDNWAWEQNALKAIKTWIQKAELSVEDAFRAFDRDFDGIMSKEDLRNGLIQLIKYEERDVIPQKVDRLYKLMDKYKRNNVQLADFKLMFQENSTSEWKESAVQQLGLELAKAFLNVNESFEKISEGAERITLAKFEKWIDSKNALSGFNLTKQLVQKLFAHLDPHKKGYLSLLDWELAFKKFTWDKHCTQELKDAIRSNFADIKSAFDFFLSFHTGTPPGKVTQLEFEQAVNALVPNRFTKSDLKIIWSTAIAGRSLMDFRDFRNSFYDSRFLSSFVPKTASAFSKSLGTSMLQPRSSLSPSMTNSATSEDDPVKKFKSLLHASPVSLEQVFKDFDTDQDGKISSNEFRKAVRRLNLGLSSRDIDLIIMRCDTNNDGQIDWLEFCKRFQSTEAQAQIKQIARGRLDRLNEHMSGFMLSPKDAFRQFDKTRSGRLDFSSFSCLVSRLSELSGDPIPAFTVVKDLFDIVDIRKDGYIDMREWLNTFKQPESSSSWEDSKLFEEAVKLIAKNRKVLQITFDSMSKSGTVSYAQAREIISSILRNLRLTDSQWNTILRVADKEGEIDYRFMLDIYKERANSRQLHPRPSI
jgi:Ca2+-binding EF-hand superfamily protein